MTPEQAEAVALELVARISRLSPGRQRVMWSKAGCESLSDYIRRVSQERTWPCLRCREWQPYSAYYYTASHSTGVPISRLCKPCSAEARAEHLQRARTDALRPPRPRWTHADLEAMNALVGTRSVEAIAARLGRTPTAVRQKLAVLGKSPAQELPLSSVTLTELKTLMGVSDYRVRQWREMGLPARTLNREIVFSGQIVLDWIAVTRPEALDLYSIRPETVAVLSSSTSDRFDPVAWLDAQPEPPAFALRQCPVCHAWAATDLYSPGYCPRQGCRGHMPIAAAAYLTSWPDPHIFAWPADTLGDASLHVLDPRAVIDDAWPVHDKHLKKRMDGRKVP